MYIYEIPYKKILEATPPNIKYLNADSIEKRLQYELVAKIYKEKLIPSIEKQLKRKSLDDSSINIKKTEDNMKKINSFKIELLLLYIIF